MPPFEPPLLDAFGMKADSSGCGVIRIELPMDALKAEGYATAYAEGAHNKLRTRVLIGQRVCNPTASPGWQDMARASNRPKLVFELDDDLWNIDSSNAIAHRYFSDPAVRGRLEANISVADEVTVTMEPLADLVRPLNPNVRVIPNYLPAWLLKHQRPRSADGTVTVGWAGSPTHLMDVQEIGGHLRQVMARNPHVELHLIGTDYRKAMGASTQDRVRFSDWTASPADYWRAIDFDVMLAPLRAHQFNASKSPLRPLEAAFLGIPVIASDYGPYGAFVRHGETGFLVRRDHEWGRYLRDLVNDPAMRAEMGAAARRQAAAWTIEGNLDEWRKVLAP